MIEKWNNFEHQVWSQLKKYNLENASSYLIAVSGGLDSMVLLEVMLRLRPQALLRAAYFHHGPCSPEQLKFRNKALQLVKHKISASIEFVTAQSEIELKTEAEMRTARWQFLQHVRRQDEAIITAHHLDDWTETALLKMIRGTSLEGISAFKTWNSNIFRPFLRLSKSELLNYGRDQKVQWIEDPSNKSEDYLRNWLRENWLKELESKQSGAVANLSRSLLQIIEQYEMNSTFDLIFHQAVVSQGLDRSWYMGLSEADQLKALALYLKTQQIFKFTRGQLEEIRKRLDKNQKEITFTLIDRKWVVNALQIMLE